VLPTNWLDRLFSVLRANYGTTFDRQWQAPDGIDPADHAEQVKATWARELAHFANHPAAIRYALDNLPDYPPSLPQFRGLCREGLPRAEAAPALPPPKADPAPPEVMEALRGLRAKFAMGGKS
jgi:hypothetical protein